MNALNELPVIHDQTAFNLDRWDELCADPLLADIDGKIETDRFGQVIMNFPAEFSHGGKQFEIGSALQKFLPGGKVTVECPISTSEGVKVADAAWISAKRLAKIGGRTALAAAPEICVEVLSPSNTRNEIEEKRRLYFEAGAREVWICERDGRMRFFTKAAPARAAAASALCPQMPSRVEG
jgi:Uma2 family endonuclease